MVNGNFQKLWRFAEGPGILETQIEVFCEAFKKASLGITHDIFKLIPIFTYSINILWAFIKCKACALEWGERWISASSRDCNII